MRHPAAGHSLVGIFIGDRGRMDGIELSVFHGRLVALCEEMGAVLQHAALSPNIKDRLDFSCALFDPQGRLCAQAAHIPVHLGSMAYAMSEIVALRSWLPGEMIVLNDPYLGGTHLPDVTVIAPVYAGPSSKPGSAHASTYASIHASIHASAHALTLVGFVANRAHHADIGANAPGSMPLARTLEEEGIIIAPTRLVENDRLVTSTLNNITRALGNPVLSEADFAAQISANRIGVERIAQWIAKSGIDAYFQGLAAVNDYARTLVTHALATIPEGVYSFRDVMDSDGFGAHDIPIVVTVQVTNARVQVDFAGTASQVSGNINCPLAVTAAAVYYAVRCLFPAHTPDCAGSFDCVVLSVPPGSLLNACRPAAVAAGNVETSMRIVDVLLGALAPALRNVIPAASYGTMNNVAMGARSSPASWDYYETIGGGMGAGAHGPGLSAVQAHMTNTRNTPIESLEMHYPLRVCRYARRWESGGRGKFNGGDGLIREYEFQSDTQVTLLTERRLHSPWGLEGGEAGMCGENVLDGVVVPGKVYLNVRCGQRLCVKTPGGGGWGRKELPK